MKNLSNNTTIFSPLGGDAAGRGGLKKLLLLLTTAFFLLTSSHAQQWIDISDRIPGDPQTFYDIHFISHDTGWITSLSVPEIYYTTDAALTFVSQDNEYDTDILAIFMLNATVGYAGGNSGIVYKTINSGEDWDFHGTLGGATITDIDFPPGSTTESSGYGCADWGKIFEITSSGISQMTSNMVSNMASITFPYSTEGWVCGENTIRHYTGGTWTADQSYPSGGYNSIYFVPGTTQGWCVGDGGRILHTTNGMSWQIQTNPDTTGYMLSDVFFKDTSYGWAVGNGGIILHTTNGGASWVLQNSGTTNNLYRVFAIADDVYATGFEVLLKWGEEVSVAEFDVGFSFEIFPNPAVSVVSCQLSVVSSESAVVEIYDLNGKKLLEKQIPARPSGGPAGTETVEINVSHLKSGVYFCKLNTEKYSITKKLLIQK